MRRAIVALCALLAAGCGQWGAPASWESRMEGLWLEERQDMAVYYWFKPDGTGERLRRAGAHQDKLPTPFAWSVEDGALEMTVEGEDTRELGAIAEGEAAGVLRLRGGEVTWFGCDSGRLPAEFEGLCRL